MQTFRTPS